jgi:integrase
MSTQSLAVVEPKRWDALQEQLDALVQMVMNSVSSPHSRAAYGHALREFIAWWGPGYARFNKALVASWKAQLEADGYSPATVNQRLTAVRKLAQEAADNGLLKPETAIAVARVRGAQRHGVRAGNWLTREQAQAILLSPDIGTLQGKRDRALLAVLFGCGLRRSEACALTLEHIQQRESRWCIVDLVGKHNRVRTVPVPNWVQTALDRWTQAAGITTGHVFRAVNKSDRMWGAGITPKVVREIVCEYARRIGVSQFSAHDARRTFAKLCRQTDAALEQIQLLLGHASVQTTEKYLGTQLDLEHAANDRLRLKA